MSCILLPIDPHSFVPLSASLKTFTYSKGWHFLIFVDNRKELGSLYSNVSSLRCTRDISIAPQHSKANWGCQGKVPFAVMSKPHWQHVPWGWDSEETGPWTTCRPDTGSKEGEMPTILQGSSTFCCYWALWEMILLLHTNLWQDLCLTLNSFTCANTIQIQVSLAFCQWRLPIRCPLWVHPSIVKDIKIQIAVVYLDLTRLTEKEVYLSNGNLPLLH